MKFLDSAKIFVKSGDGGAGCVSFRREAHVEYGGPDGGDGGRGGDVIIEAVDGLNTLIDFRYQQHFKAKTGGHGMGKNRYGAGGDSITLRVPVGTQIFDDDSIVMLADFTYVGQRVILLKGGQGGRGNTRFKSSRNQAPRRFDPGEEGQERWIRLRLKLIADAGLVGLPNAGKSTFLSAVSRAKPKVADYPFTTLTPVLGVVHVDQTEFVIADIPGLIEGASEGAGLGIRFLKHLTRNRILLHLVDIAPCDGSDPSDGAVAIVRELERFSPTLAARPRWLVINKVDLIDAETLAARKKELLAALDWAGPTYEISALGHRGTRELSGDLMTHIEALDEQMADDADAVAAERLAQESMQQEARERIEALREQQAVARRNSKTTVKNVDDEGDDVAVEYRH